jgi:hypothetical protein
MAYNIWHYEVMLLKVYMDVCCLSRPFDDQSQDKVRFEAEAVISILKHCVSGGDWELVVSDIITIEISKIQDPIKKQKIQLLSYLPVNITSGERANL